MPKKDTNLKKMLLQELLEDSLTKSEITEAFKKIIAMVKDMREKNGKSMAEINETLTRTVKEHINNATSDLGFTKQEIKAIVESELNRLNKKFLDNVSEVDFKMSLVKDGKDADESKIVEKVLGSLDYPTVDILKQEMPKFGEEIRNGLELLQGDERLDVSAIRGIEETLKEIKEEVKQVRQSKRVFAGPNANAVNYADLTDECDGSNKTFTVPTHRKVIALMGTQFPVIYRPIIDFTTVNQTLTLTDAVSAPESGQTLTFLYVK